MEGQVIGRVLLVRADTGLGPGPEPTGSGLRRPLTGDRFDEPVELQSESLADRTFAVPPSTLVLDDCSQIDEGIFQTINPLLCVHGRNPTGIRPTSQLPPPPGAAPRAQRFGGSANWLAQPWPDIRR